MIIGVDLGGTNIRVGIETNGQITHQQHAKLQFKDSLPKSLQQVTAMIKPFMSPAIKGIGIGVPSVVDTEKGIVFNVVNIPSWERVPLKDLLEEVFKVPVFVNNDVNCFILGEHRFGLAKGYHSVVGMAVGTALGSGIIINNQLYMGNNCGAGEIGLLPYQNYNLEYYASGNLFKTFYQTTAFHTHELALQGDLQALKIWEEFGTHLGQAVKYVMYAYDPQAIVIGGSVSKAYRFFSKSMLDSLRNFIFPESVKRIKIFQSQNENISLLGAAALVPDTVAGLPLINN